MEAQRFRTNRYNDGKAFEDMFFRSCDAYFNQKLLRLMKVEPPLKVLGHGRVIFLDNPYPDFTGAWTERGGRSLMIETKSTSGEDGGKLPFGKGGLSLKQIEWLKRWHWSGAAVGTVWNWSGHGTVFIPIGQVCEILKGGRKHIKFEECDLVEQGKGFVLVDFLANLRRWYPA